MYFPILINWTSPFPILGLLGGIFYFYSNFKRNFCKQTVENLIRRRILRCLIWFCTQFTNVPQKTLGLYGLKKKKKKEFTTKAQYVAPGNDDRESGLLIDIKSKYRMILISDLITLQFIEETG